MSRSTSAPTLRAPEPTMEQARETRSAVAAPSRGPGEEPPAPPAEEGLEPPPARPASPRLSSFYVRRGRRALDLAVVGLMLPLALPVAALIALVNLVLFRDPRQVFFRQPRIGLDERVFLVLKFRTMREARRDAMSSWSSGEDRLRVTRFGRLLRNTHLDELPQLFNVLRGDMGLIGPRPEMLEIEAWAREAIPDFGRRLAIRPGLTGLAQITQGYTGRDEEAYRAKLEINLDYLEQVGLATDLAILFRTAIWMLRGRGWWR